MKILYGVQGTGHGHITRAKVLLPKIRERADVDVLISGYNYNIPLDDIRFKARGISFRYDNNGAIDLLDTAMHIRPGRIIRDVQSLPVDDYDMVINDFEPISAWAAASAGIPCVAISHQASFLSSHAPRPKRRSLFAEKLFKHFAPSTAAVGSHYRRYDDFIEPPIIRKQIRKLSTSKRDHVTVYLPAFDHQTLCSVFSQISETQWEIFSPGCTDAYTRGNVRVYPVGNESFLRSIEECHGIVSSAGFELTSEAMYLEKKLLVIPIQKQYEQWCNAAALSELGGAVSERIDGNFSAMLRQWLKQGRHMHLPEISDADHLAERIISAGIAELEPVAS